MASTKDIEELIENEYLNYGKNLYLLGTAEFGSTNEPIKIKSLAHLYSIFGTKGSLIDSYKSIIKASSDLSVYCCKVSGTHSVAAFNVNVAGDKVKNNALVFKSKCSNEIYNDISINIYYDRIVFNLPELLGGNSLEYLYADYEVLGELVAKINKDTDLGINHVYSRITVEDSTPLVGALDTVNISSKYLYGATNGMDVSKNSLYSCLKETLDILEGMRIDIIVPINAFIDDIEIDSAIYGQSLYSDCNYAEKSDKLNCYDDGNKANYYSLIVKFCAKQLVNGVATLGVMGYNKTDNKYLNEDIDGYIKKTIVSLENNILESEFDIYRPLVSVVAGDIVTTQTGSNINGYIQYAAKLCSIRNIDTPTNSPIQDNIFLYNEFDNEQLQTLANNGIVAFRHSPLKKCVVTSAAVTTGNKEEEMFYVQNIKMVQFATACLYSIFEKFIGEDINSLMENNKLKEYIVSGLDVLVNRNVISDYKINMTRTTGNDIKLELLLKTQYMIEFVKSICSLECKGEEE